MSLEKYRRTKIDYRDTVISELHIMGYACFPLDEFKIGHNTPAGMMSYTPCYDQHMADVYRFIHHYGLKVSQWALESKVKLLIDGK